MATLDVLRALNSTPLPERVYLNSPGSTAWSNLIFSQSAAPVGDDPITLLLRLLISTGYGTNYSGTPPNYDVYEAGVGLGIPIAQIDIPSFTAIQAQFDWDLNQGVFFHLTQPEAAKDFIDNELCRPFGIYLRTGNDGIIRCVRPRHPQKFYVGSRNQTIAVKYPATSGTVYNATLPIGVFTAQQMTTNVATALNAVVPGGGFTCTYNTAAWKFTLSKSNTFDMLSSNVVATPDLGWTTLGWTSLPVLATTSSLSPTARGQFIGSTLTQNDLWGVRMIDNHDDQINSIVYKFDYDADHDTYRSSRAYFDAEAVNLAGITAPHDYIIESRGLISGASNTAPWVVYYKLPVSGCDPAQVKPAAASGVDADTWAQLFALSLLDRYKHPPLKFSARLKWAWNTLEVGDVVRVSYNIPNVFTDYERNAATLTNRLFEIVELHPNFDGSLDATFLGHRYVSY